MGWGFDCAEYLGSGYFGGRSKRRPYGNTCDGARFCPSGSSSSSGRNVKGAGRDAGGTLLVRDFRCGAVEFRYVDCEFFVVGLGAISQDA